MVDGQAHCVVDEYVGYGDEGGRSYYEYKHQGGDVAVHLVRYHSPEEAMATWQRDMGENLIELLEVNPFLPEFEINLKLLQRQDYGVETVGACVVCLQVDFKFGEKRQSLSHFFQWKK